MQEQILSARMIFFFSCMSISLALTQQTCLSLNFVKKKKKSGHSVLFVLYQFISLSTDLVNGSPQQRNQYSLISPRVFPKVNSPLTTAANKSPAARENEGSGLEISSAVNNCATMAAITLS